MIDPQSIPPRAAATVPRADIPVGIRDVIHRNTAYDFIGVTAPAELRELATRTGNWLANSELRFEVALRHPRFTCASNLYRRMGDLELYVTGLAQELRDPSPWRAAVVGGSLIVGYFSTAKSILDAAAITLNELFSLNLAPRQQDLSKGQFWTALARVSRNAHDRYARYRKFVDEVVQWRDASVHRATPLLMVHTDRPQIEGAPRDEIRVRMAARPDVTLSTFPGIDPAHWIDPLQIPARWRDEFLGIFRLLTEDIAR